MGSKAILLSLSSIGILIFGLSSCPTMSEAQADELNDSVATHPSFIVQPVISLALQPTVNVDLVPQSNGSFGATTPNYPFPLIALKVIPCICLQWMVRPI